MEITLTFVGLFLLGCGLGYPVMIFAKNRGPIPWLLMPMIAYSLPLFTIGPHPTILGLYLPLAAYLLYVGQMVIRNPSAINEFWLNFGNEESAHGYPLIHSKNSEIFSRDFRSRFGTFASSYGYPTGITNIACSCSGRLRISRRNPIGEGV